METKKTTPAPLVYKEEVINGNVMQPWSEPKSERTRLIIATELDAAEREYQVVALASSEAIARIKALTAELKNYGVKRRAPKGTP